jgi:hypothetical protein
MAPPVRHGQARPHAADRALAVGASLSAIAGALTSAWLRVDDARACESEIAPGRFDAFVNGTRGDERRACELVRTADTAGSSVA